MWGGKKQCWQCPPHAVHGLEHPTLNHSISFLGEEILKAVQKFAFLLIQFPCRKYSNKSSFLQEADLAQHQLREGKRICKDFFFILSTHRVNLRCNISSTKAIPDSTERLLPPNTAEFNAQPLSNVLYEEPDWRKRQQPWSYGDTWAEDD